MSFEALVDSMQARSRLPLLMVVQTPNAECEPQAHADDGLCWCDPVITALGEGVYLVRHRRFEN